MILYRKSVLMFAIWRNWFSKIPSFFFFCFVILKASTTILSNTEVYLYTDKIYLCSYSWPSLDYRWAFLFVASISLHCNILFEVAATIQYTSIHNSEESPCGIQLCPVNFIPIDRLIFFFLHIQIPNQVLKLYQHLQQLTKMSQFQSTSYHMDFSTMGKYTSIQNVSMEFCTIQEYSLSLKKKEIPLPTLVSW